MIITIDKPPTNRPRPNQKTQDTRHTRFTVSAVPPRVDLRLADFSDKSAGRKVWEPFFHARAGLVGTQ